MDDFRHALDKVNISIDEYNDVKELFNDSEYQENLNIIRKYSDMGNPEALSWLGLIYQQGLGLDRNLNLAIELLSKAANKGSGEAAHNLGTLYVTCEPDMPYDPKKSKYWYRKAKELGLNIATDDFYED